MEAMMAASTVVVTDYSFGELEIEMRLPVLWALSSSP